MVLKSDLGFKWMEALQALQDATALAIESEEAVSPDK